MENNLNSSETDNKETYRKDREETQTLKEMYIKSGEV